MTNDHHLDRRQVGWARLVPGSGPHRRLLPVTGPACSAPVAGTEADDELGRIAREYPAWHVWRSQAGRWWATRLGDIRRAADRDADYATTLDADTAGELRAALAAQSSFGPAIT